MADDEDGYRLARQLDEIFAAGNARDNMGQHFPNPQSDIVPERHSLKERLSTAALLGMVTVGVSGTVIEIGNQIISTMQGLH